MAATSRLGNPRWAVAVPIVVVGIPSMLMTAMVANGHVTVYISTMLLIMLSTCAFILYNHRPAGTTNLTDGATAYLGLDIFLNTAFVLLLPRARSRESIDYMLTASNPPLFSALSLTPMQLFGPVFGILTWGGLAVVMHREEHTRRKQPFAIALACNWWGGALLVPLATRYVHGYETAAALWFAIVLYVLLWRISSAASTVWGGVTFESM